MTLTKKLIAFVAAVFLHAAVIYLFYLNQQDRSLILSALWSGGKSGGDVVTMVDITTLEEDVASADVKNTDDQVAPKIKSHKQVKLPQPPLAKRGVNDGDGNSDTPVGGVGSGLDIMGSPENKSVLAQIRKKIMRKKIYPLHAQENNITGQVSVAFQINQDGSLKSVFVKKSSGFSELDAAAVTAIKRAVPLPYYPAVIALTMEYHLEKD